MLNLNKILKSIIIDFLCVLLLISPTTLVTYSDSANNSVADDLIIRNNTRTPYMIEVLSETSNISGKDNIKLYGVDAVSLEKEIKIENNINDNPESVIVFDNAYKSINWEFNVINSGRYLISVKYTILGTSGNNAVRDLKINNKTPFYEADNLVFQRDWIDVGEKKINSIGDEVRKEISEKVGWKCEYLYDSRGLYSTPLIFYFEKGINTIELQYVSQDMAIEYIEISPYVPLQSYSELSKNYQIDSTNNALITFQAEDSVLSKNDPTIRVESDPDPATYPEAYGRRVFNAIGGYRWRKANQSVVFEFNIENSGYYKIAFRYKQSWNDGMPSYRTIMIDDNIPFAEFQNVEFPYNNDWQTITLGNEDPYFVYLEKGKHKLTVTVSLGEIGEIIRAIYDDMVLLSSILQQIMKLTGSEPDPNYDYEFFKNIPSLEGEMTSLVDDLQHNILKIRKISKRNTSIEGSLKSIVEEIQSLINDPFTIAKKYNQITQAQTSLGTWYLNLQESPLMIDNLIVAGSKSNIKHKEASFYKKLKSFLHSFFLSFTRDYTNLASVLNENVKVTDVIDVWIARGSEWAEIIKEMADESFTPNTGILINMNIVPASQLNTGSANALLLSIISGTNPDVAMGVSSSSPVEFAIRDTVVDVSKFDEFSEVKSRFLEDIFIPYQYNNGVFAIPETMNFTCLFYRKDILEQYSIAIPETRDQLREETLPLLYENGLSYYQSQDFTQFLYQHNGKYYSDDGKFSALDSLNAYVAFKEYTEMFTHYSSPVNASFFNRFRTGETPIGIGNYALYLQLCTAAPELTGKWNIASIPGVVDENNNLNCSYGGIAAECDVILRGNNSSTKNASWKFLKWWTSTEVQQNYAREIEALMGVGARWNTANIDAFYSLEWDRNDLEIFKKQFTWATETPVVLGGYYTSRYLLNAFTNVVVTGTSSPRDALESAVKEINRELKMKQDEYGVK